MNIDSFVKIPYPMIIQESDDKVLVFIPKLFISVEGDNLAHAYELSQFEKRKFYKRLEDIDGLHLIPKVSDIIPLRNRFDIQRILIERFFSFFLTLFLGLVLILILGNQVGKVLGKIDQAFLPASEEKKEVRLQRFKEKLEVVAPYIKEVKKVMND